MADWFELVRTVMDIPEYFREMVPDFQDEQTPVCCPFHDDNTASLSINPNNGLWKCHAASCGKQGDVFKFHMFLHEMDSVKDAVIDLAERYDVNLPTKLVVPIEDVNAWHEKLKSNAPMLEDLSKLRGISTDTLLKARIGHNGKRFTIPIFDRNGDCLNVRQYSPSPNAKFKFTNYTGPEKQRGFGRMRLYPFFAMSDSRPLVLTEGEFDALIARDNGFNALTCTGGAGNWNVDWNKDFKDKTVFIVYDNDPSGEAGALMVAKNLSPFARSIRIVKIPIDKKGADVTHFFKAGNSAEDFQKLLDNAPEYQTPKADVPEEEDNTPVDVDLFQASNAENTGKVVRFSARISGHDPEPYIVPCQFRVKCGMVMEKLCSHCPVAEDNGDRETTIGKFSEDLLKLVNISNENQRHVLKRLAGVPEKCSANQIEVTANFNIQELVLVPETEAHDMDADKGSKYMLQTVFHVYDKGNQTESNRAYILTGKVAPNPKTQKATIVLDTAFPKDDSVEAFDLDAAVIKHLNVLKADHATKESLDAKFDELATDLEHVTRIIDRREILKAVLLTYFSPLHFKFKGEVFKGWVDCLIIGDTRSGKSSTVMKLRKHFRAGDIGSGETSSFAGLVGGLQQINGRWVLNWGGIPLADKRLYMIDEASGLDTEQISRMSDLRSTGVAEIKKIRTESTMARTRLVWIANARSNRALSNHPFGVVAIKELIGRPEDISRFDFAIGVSSGDVDKNKINNATFDEKYELTFDSDTMHKAILNAWSLRVHQIEFHPEAVEFILAESMRMGDKYSPECPLVNASEQRVKLARLAASCAILFQSTEDWETWTVQRCHVEWVVDFLETAFDSRALHYDVFSRSKMSQEKLRLVKRLEDLIDPEDAQQLLDLHEVTREDVEICFRAMDRKATNDILKTLRSCNAIRKDGRSLVFNEPFIAWLQIRAKEIQVNERLNAPKKF